MIRRVAVILTVTALAGCLFGGGGALPPAQDLGVVDDTASNAQPGDASEVDARSDLLQTCGDGALQAHERCDPNLPADSQGACPTSCDDGLACTNDVLEGSPETCDAVCTHAVISACINGDGCCPSDCVAANDDDCVDSVVCGDGVVSGTETCDPGILSGDGACPTLADCPVAACMTQRITGSPTMCDAACAATPITACVSGDGCCPAGCNASNDSDCSATCGNGVVEPGEVCDSNCPTSCDDGNPCTTGTLQGSAATCDAICISIPVTSCTLGDLCCPPGCTSATDTDCSATCGDGVVDAPNETCDPPSSCPTDCDDGNACTDDVMTGSAANCNVRCQHNIRTVCVSDGCCAPGCTANNDPDCGSTCGNGIVEPGETCDQNCPTTCDDQDACTTDTMTGSATACTLQCTNTPVTSCVSGDGCCPPGCNANNDSDCGSVCGNGVIESGETCDGNCPPSCNDGNACTLDVRSGTSAQCNVTCTYSDITSCVHNDGCCPAGCNAVNDNDCSATCGNSIVEPPETCDGNCPTAQMCANMGPCYTRIGSPAQCNVRCIETPGCVACDRNSGGPCPCAAGEECNNNVCEPSNGDGCTNACDEAAFCGVHGGPGWLCDENDDFCKECLVTADCTNPIHACQGNSCMLANVCHEAKGPNAWCLWRHGVGWQCDQNGESGGGLDGCYKVE